MINQPFIHIINTPLYHYIYDVNTNRLIKIPDNIYNQFLAYIERDEKTSEVLRYVNALKEAGYLSTYHPVEMEHSESDFVEYHLGCNIEQMTLQLTQQCNFRCSYCIYAPKDIEYQRQHTSKHMTLELALKAVDFFAQRSIDREKVCIGFYGGEPLLEFKLIKEIVKYAEEIFEGKELLFTITTNGSLFTKEIAEFLGNHNFSILVSLDGTAEIHNRSRKFASTGKGTYDVIEEKLLALQKDYPKLYEHISFNVVIDPRFSCNELHDMFSFNPLYSSANVSTTLIDDSMSMEHVTTSDKYLYESNVHLFKAYMAAFKRYPSERTSKIAKLMISTTRERITKAMTAYKRLPETISHSGPCIPGQRRLFVDVDGNLFPCERVSETSPINKIGHIDNAFDYNKIKALLNIVQLTPEECRNCWAILHCLQCARACDNNGELSAELKRSNCKATKTEVENSLKEYLMYKEFGYEFN